MKWAAVSHASSFATRHSRRTRESPARRHLDDSSQRSRTLSAVSNQLCLGDDESYNVIPTSATNQSSDSGLHMLLSPSMDTTPWDGSIPDPAWSSLIGVSLGAEHLPEPFEPSFCVNTTVNGQETDPEVPVIGEVGSTTPGPNPWSTNDSLGPLLSATLSSPSEEIAYTYCIFHSISTNPPFTH